jgi:hypothetical protein
VLTADRFATAGVMDLLAYGFPVGVEVGGPAGVEVDVWVDPGVEVGGPAGVEVDVWSDPGVEVGGPAGVDAGA